MSKELNMQLNGLEEQKDQNRNFKNINITNLKIMSSVNNYDG